LVRPHRGGVGAQHPTERLDNGGVNVGASYVEVVAEVAQKHAFEELTVATGVLDKHLPWQNKDVMAR